MGVSASRWSRSPYSYTFLAAPNHKVDVASGCHEPTSSSDVARVVWPSSQRFDGDPGRIARINRSGARVTMGGA